jgi:TetR/AcrR family transcriptional regulator, repressor for uid operon
MTAMRATEPGAETSTRQRLLDAATAVFAESGYEGARVQEIARRAGLTTGAIYGRFRDKADLLMEAIGARSADELDDLISPVGAVPSAGEILVAMGRELMAGPASDKGALLIEALVAARRDPELSSMVKGNLADQARKLRGTVEHARRQGAIGDTVDTDAFVAFGLALAFGTLLFKAIDLPRPDEGSWSTLITRLVGALADDPDEKEPT